MLWASCGVCQIWKYVNWIRAYICVRISKMKRVSSGPPCCFGMIRLVLPVHNSEVWAIKKVCSGILTRMWMFLVLGDVLFGCLLNRSHSSRPDRLCKGKIYRWKHSTHISRSDVMEATTTHNLTGIVTSLDLRKAFDSSRKAVYYEDARLLYFWRRY